jgi:WXG100 family type VII secretion target
MATRLRVVEDDLNKFAQDFTKEQQDVARVLSSINSSISQLGGSFKGKAGRAFLGYWNGTGRKHTQAISNQMKKMNEKITRINKMAGDLDEECGNMFGTDID